MAFGDIARRGGEKIQITPNLGDDLLAGEQMHPCRRQLNAQRDAINQPANLRNGRQVIGAGLKLATGPPGCL